MTRRRRLRLLVTYARPQRWHVLLLVLSAALPAALAAIEPLSLKLLIDNALGGQPLTGAPAELLDRFGIADEPRSLVVVAAVLAAATMIGNFVALDMVGVYTEWVGARMVRQASRDVFDALQRLSPSYHARASSGDSLTRVTTDSYAVYTAVSATFLAPAVHVITIAAIGWSAFRLSPDLTVLLLVVAPIVAVVSRRVGLRLRARAREARNRSVEVTSLVSQIVSALPVVQAYTGERQNLATYRRFADRSVTASSRVARLETGGDMAGSVVGACGLAVVLVVGGYAVTRGTVSVGDLVVFVAYAKVLDAQLRALLGLGLRLRQAEVGLDRMIEVLDCPDRVLDPSDPVPIPVAVGGAALDLDDVSFGYDPDRGVLHHLTLHVARGETVAIVGPTGAGKSTLVGLVSRLYDPIEGRVAMEGVDLRHASLSEVRGRVSVLRQEPALLAISLAENIAIGRPGATRAQIEDAARAAQVHDAIAALPNGYDTILAPGTALSGGERQRVGIARAFLKDAPVLVLDEPTSALDADAESALVESLARISEGRTVLVIAHRLATVRDADRVLVIDDGRLVELGSHDDLLEVDGMYARFHRLQSTGVPS